MCIRDRDSRNPYSSGVLVGNYVEDKFGAEAAMLEVSSPQYNTLLMILHEISPNE